jgi:outer membrane murein-binding lipoprotein Lpp
MTLKKLFKNGGFPSSADDACGCFHRTEFGAFSHNEPGPTLYTMYDSGATYLDITMLPARSSIFTTTNFGLQERATTRGKQMQVTTTSSWNSKKRGAVSHLMLVVCVAILAGLNAGCSSSAKTTAPAPAEVNVAEVICKQIGDSDEFTGRLEAVHAVEVRPRVSGYLQSVHFKEGEIVGQGDLLFQIDPRPFQAEVDRLKGELSQAKAQRSRAQSDFERAERLHNNDGMSA